jgi:hypothetical protein
MAKQFADAYWRRRSPQSSPFILSLTGSCTNRVLSEHAVRICAGCYGRNRGQADPDLKLDCERAKAKLIDERLYGYAFQGRSLGQNIRTQDGSSSNGPMYPSGSPVLI